MKAKYDKILWELREADEVSNLNLTSSVTWYTLSNIINNKVLDGNNFSLEDLVNTLWTLINDLQLQSWQIKKHIITLPEEVTSNINYHQWLWLYCKNNINIQSVDIIVWSTPSWWTPSLKCNIYKSSWVLADGLDNNAIKLFTNDLNVWTNYNLLNNVPNINVVESWKYLTLRITESTWTILASDLQVIITYI